VLRFLIGREVKDRGRGERSVRNEARFRQEVEGGKRAKLARRMGMGKGKGKA